jgi:acid phosphatase (class A)
MTSQPPIWGEFNVKTSGMFSISNMGLNITRLTGILIVLAILAVAHAQGREARIYLPVGSVDAANLIEPPPAEDSYALREQMAVVLWLQQTRTPDQIAFAEQTLDLDRFVPILRGSLLDADGIELKRTLDAVIDEVRTEYDALKGRYNLRRPFEINDAAHPVGEARPVAAYPSGHAIRATVYARLLAEIFPEHREALLELGRQIGYGRVIAGAHFPIDVLAGQKLGEHYSDTIVKQKTFLEAVARIRRSASHEETD